MPKMKGVSNKVDNKKRKRDEPEETIAESPKRTKVHAQRKFAQGAAFNSPIITPIKDKVRPAASVSALQPLLSTKRPNTEDFLTFLCFRRTSILPPKLDFFKEALKPDSNSTKPSSSSSSSASQKFSSDQNTRSSSKKIDKVDENKKPSAPAVQALRKKYQEQRLAKQKPTNVTKLAQKVKGKNMIRTRSSTLNEEVKAPRQQPIIFKESKNKISGLRSGLQRVAPGNKKQFKKPMKANNARTGLRSSSSKNASDKDVADVKPSPAANTKKAEVAKKAKIEIPEAKPKIVRGVGKKSEGFSDFSSDDNEPLSASKRTKFGVKKIMEKPTVEVKEDKKPSVKTRSQLTDPENSQTPIRPTRKTKEAAAIYMEMITKKLVSPERSGDDDISSVDSFPELPNARRNEQRESEIKAKALAVKRNQNVEIKPDTKEKEIKRGPGRKSEPAKPEQKKEENAKKTTPAGAKKEAKPEEKNPASSKKAAKATAKVDKAKSIKSPDGSAKSDSNRSTRPSTRSRSQEDIEVTLKKAVEKNLVKKSKLILAKNLQKRASGLSVVLKNSKKPRMMKEGAEIRASKEDLKSPNQNKKEAAETKKKKVAAKPVEKNEKKEVKSKKDAAKENSEKIDSKAESKSSGSKSAKNDEANEPSNKATGKTVKAEKKKADSPEEVETNSNKRPTRKCSTVDKIWIDIDGFTSDEEDFVDVKSIASTRSYLSKSADERKPDIVENPKKKTKRQSQAQSLKKEKDSENQKNKGNEKPGDEGQRKGSESSATKKNRANNKEDVKDEALKSTDKADKTNEKDKKGDKPPGKSEKSESSSAKKSEAKAKAASTKKGKAKEAVSKGNQSASKEAAPKKLEKKNKSVKKLNKSNETVVSDQAKDVKVKSDEAEKPAEKKITNLDSKEASVPKENNSTPNSAAPKAEIVKEETAKASTAKPDTEKEPENETADKTSKATKVTEKSSDSKDPDNKKSSDSSKNVNNENHNKKSEKNLQPDSENKKEQTKKPIPSSKSNRNQPEVDGNEKSSRSLRERSAFQKRSYEEFEPSEEISRRTRPVRQCSTGEKMWIESDSDSFNFFEESSDEDDLPILDFSSKKQPTKATKEPEKKATESAVDDFSDSDEEPLKKKTVSSVSEQQQQQQQQQQKQKPKQKKEEIIMPEKAGETVSVVEKATREVPMLYPLKRPQASCEVQVDTKKDFSVKEKSSPVETPRRGPVQSVTLEIKEPRVDSAKNFKGKSEISGVEPRSVANKGEISDYNSVTVTERKAEATLPSYGPMKIDMLLQSLKNESKLNSTDISITSAPYGNVPEPNIFESSKQLQIVHSPPSNIPNRVVCTFPAMNLSRPREPINTHGLDLLSEVALPSVKDRNHLQTERIEKWLKESLAAGNKKSFPAYEDVDYKCSESENAKNLTERKFYHPEVGHSYVPPLSQPTGIHQDLRKFEHIEMIESQKMFKKQNIKTEIKQDRSEQTSPKKMVTSVQDWLKLQKERKEIPKPTIDNSPHSKNCKCNSCVVKKGWFKNKPVPKLEELKGPGSLEELRDSNQPFQSLSKAFHKVSSEGRNTKMSVSVAPIVHSAPATPTTSSAEVSPGGKILFDKKPIFQQRKMSFLERMKERERKEANAMRPKANAFSPSNESSVYAFEPEPEQTAGVSAPFRSKTRDSRASSTATSKSEEDVLKICEDDVTQTASAGTQSERSLSDPKSSCKASQSASIAVQVNLDCETTTQVETVQEIPDSKSIEISTQTEVPEEDSDSPMFYIPLQQSAGSSSSTSEQQLIQGVALKLDTEGPMGPNQRVIMKAKLVTKSTDAPSIKAVVMPQPKRIFDQKSNNPPVGTVQPTARKPPEVFEESSTSKSAEGDSIPAPKRLAKGAAESCATELVSQASTDSGVESEVLPAKIESPSPVAKSSAGKGKEKASHLANKDKFEFFDENSPSSSTSSAKTKRVSKQKSSETVINPSNNTWLPPAGGPSKLVEAPTFHPTEKEFQDPLEFFDRIRPAAEKFGLCRIVPPRNFKPDCKVTDDMRFTAYNQYVHRLFHRWGPNVKEMMAIKKYLATQSISLKQPPWIGGIEVDLPRLYQCVQNCGGLMKVMEKKKWPQVADMMKIPKAAQDRVTKLDDIYCKYLLPYDTLSHDERQKLFDEVEKDWSERQRCSSESQDSQNEDESEDENYIDECEECIAKGRNMALNQFYRIARNSMSMWFKNAEPPPSDVENEFWKHVSERNHHVCVHSGSIDSSCWGYGFPIAKNNSFSKHPWNLKVLTNNSGSVLRSLGSVMGVTVPTLHVGMVFTAFCWYRDPHGLPWIEYLHTGAPKIWYGISDDNSKVFQEALTKLLPRYIKNKTIWLPSDTAMVPPSLLVEHGVSLCHTIQEPGQFILVFPRAFTSSICTGYLVSESVYFAQPSWLTTAEQVFKVLQESCEPTMFSLEKLLFSIATDSRSNVEVLKQVLPMVWHVRQKELDGRKTLSNLGLKSSERLPLPEPGSKKRKGRWAQEDDGDYECEICRTNLYVSLVTNSHEEGVYCLPHATELLTQKRHQLKYCKLMYSYSQEEMDELIEKLEQRIESKSQKKLHSKSSTSVK